LTITSAEPDLDVSWAEVAVIVAIPRVVGVKTPALLTAPIPDGLTDQETVLLKLPVPITVGAQVEVWVVRTDEGEQATATDVIVTCTGAMVTLAEPVFVESWVDVALMDAIPEAGTLAGAVYKPEVAIVPESADQVTAEL
jgi:hypothetical protein